MTVRLSIEHDTTSGGLIQNCTVLQLALFFTLACETGGRWSKEVKNYVGALTTHKSEQYTRALRKSMKLAYTRRFWSLLSVAALKGITASVEGIGEIDDSGSFLQMPHFEEVLAGLDIPPEVSRLA